jgi:hypothetical protein
MLIKSVLRSKEFELLRGQYVSFVQIGGAYAHNYKPIIDFLGIKSVLITDLDYDKDSSNTADVLASGSTNATINKFAELILKDSVPTVQVLYDWQEKSAPIVVGSICLAFQGKNDHFSRTLEEEMLTKHYGITALDVKPKEDWKKHRKDDKLKFTIFMYLVILNGLVDTMLPTYIKEAALRLTK